MVRTNESNGQKKSHNGEDKGDKRMGNFIMASLPHPYFEYPSSKSSRATCMQSWPF